MMGQKSKRDEFFVLSDMGSRLAGLFHEHRVA